MWRTGCKNNVFEPNTMSASLKPGQAEDKSRPLAPTYAVAKAGFPLLKESSKHTAYWHCPENQLKNCSLCEAY